MVVMMSDAKNYVPVRPGTTTAGRTFTRVQVLETPRISVQVVVDQDPKIDVPDHAWDDFVEEAQEWASSTFDAVVETWPKE